MRVLLIDNYDSFTYNIVALLRQLHVDDLTVPKNDEIEAAEAALYDAILLSPGPALPAASGNLLDIVRQLAPTHPILGICLGHQAIAEAFDGQLRNEALPYHGYQTSLRFVKPHHLFDGLPRDLQDADLAASYKVGLYHSWSVDEAALPEMLEVTAYSAEGNIMAMRHKIHNVHGVQFHPESYMTEYGKELIWNFLNAV